MHLLISCIRDLTMIFSSLFSVVGMAVLFLIAWVFSSNKRAINYRTIVSAFVIQVALGALALYVPLGREMLQGLASGIQSVISYGYEGVRFYLAISLQTLRAIKG